MKKENYIDVLNECFRNLEKVNLINTQIINSNAQDKVKTLSKHSYGIVESELQRISQMIILLQKE